MKQKDIERIGVGKYASLIGRHGDNTYTGKINEITPEVTVLKPVLRTVYTEKKPKKAFVDAEVVVDNQEIQAIYEEDKDNLENYIVQANEGQEGIEGFSGK